MSASPSRPGPFQRLRPSLLDRLIDDQPDSQSEAPVGEAQLIRELRQSVRRDLEQLLNTRTRPTSWSEQLQELDDSLVNYGIPDFTAADLNAAEHPEIIVEAIEKAIRTFEPRLKEVRVRLTGESRSTDRTLRFRIDAVLQVDPLADPVRFDSVLEPTTGIIEVKGGGS